MEIYQRERYPELEHSKVEHVEVKKENELVPKMNRGEREANRIQGKKPQTGQERQGGKPRKPSEKDRIAHILKKHISESTTEHDLHERLASEGLALYHRGKTP